LSVDYEAGSDSTGTDSTGADSTGFESDFFAGVCFALDFLDSEALQDLRAGTCYFGLATTVEFEVSFFFTGGASVFLAAGFSSVCFGSSFFYSFFGSSFFYSYG